MKLNQILRKVAVRAKDTGFPFPLAGVQTRMPQIYKAGKIYIYIYLKQAHGLMNKTGIRQKIS